MLFVRVFILYMSWSISISWEENNCQVCLAGQCCASNPIVSIHCMLHQRPNVFIWCADTHVAFCFGSQPQNSATNRKSPFPDTVPGLHHKKPAEVRLDKKDVIMRLKRMSVRTKNKGEYRIRRGYKSNTTVHWRDRYTHMYALQYCTRLSAGHPASCAFASISMPMERSSYDEAHRKICELKARQMA